MTGGHGYRIRPDKQPPGEQSSIGQARRRFPRKAGRAVRDGAAGGVADYLIFVGTAGKTDRLVPLKAPPSFGYSGAGFEVFVTRTPTPGGWWLDKHGWVNDIQCTSASNPGTWRVAYQAKFSPQSLVDPDEAPAAFVLRIEDTIAAKTTSSVSNQKGSVFFGLSREAGSPPASYEPWLSIGLMASWSDPATSGNWFARIIDGSGTKLLNEDLGVDCGEAHNLAIEFDAWDRQIDYYIDGALVFQYAPLTGDIWTSVAAATDSIRTQFSVQENTAVTKCLCFCDPAALYSVRLRDLGG